MRRLCLIIVTPLAGLLASLPAMGQDLDTNILRNPGFESAGPDGWVLRNGNYQVGQWSPPGPQAGQNFYFAGACDWATIAQNLDLAALGYDATRLATGGYSVTYGGYQACWQEVWPSAWDQGMIGLEQFTSGWAANGSSNLGWQWPGNTWAAKSGTLRLNPGTTVLQYIFDADRQDMWGGNNDAYLDNASLSLHAYKIWTWGDGNDQDYAGDGPWSPGYMRIGDYGAGSLHISNGGQCALDGFSLNAAGSVNVTAGGIWSTYRTNAEFFSFLDGTVNIDGGSWDSKDKVRLGAAGTVNLQTGSWTSGRVVVGQSSDNGTVNVRLGGTWTSNDMVTLGEYFSGTGTVNISGGTWAANGRVDVGSEGTGVVNLNGTAQWRSGGSVVVGAIETASWIRKSGTVNISNASWTSTGSVEVGRGSTGTVNLNQGGTWSSAGSVALGSNPGGYGTLNVSGGNWISNGSAEIGAVSTGIVNLNPGGTWTAGQKVVFGTNPGANGTLNVAGTTWTTDGQVEIGGNGVGTVNLTQGAQWASNQAVALGYGTGGNGTVDLSSGEWSANAPVTVGQLGTGHLYIRGAGHMHVNGQMLTVGRTGNVTLDGGSLNITNGYANFASALAVTADGGTINLENSYLLHVGQRLALNGGTIRGTGEIHVGAAGLNLGTTAKPGTIEGDPTVFSPLSIYGDVSGSGTLTNLAVYGNVNVGNSAGLLTLQNATLGGGSSIWMEIAGLDPSQFDRLILDHVTFNSTPIRIAFANGFAPAGSDTFDLFDGPNLYNQLTWASIDVPDGWLLDHDTGVLYTPEPASLCLLILGGAALARRRRPRRP